MDSIPWGCKDSSALQKTADDRLVQEVGRKRLGLGTGSGHGRARVGGDASERVGGGGEGTGGPAKKDLVSHSGRLNTV